MSNHPDRKTSKHPSGSEAKGAVSSDPANSKSHRSSFAALSSTQNLERLRDRVEKAASELLRLREENARLDHRIQMLEAKNSRRPGETQISFDEPSDALVHRVKGFIRAIDKFLDADEDAPPEKGA